MKRIGIIAAAILVLVIAGILVINGRKIDTDVTREHTKVGVILNGVKNDRSWSQSHYEGMEQCAAKLNLDVEYREKVPNDETSIDVMDELIDNGCKIIICDSYSYEEWELEVAKEHPEVYFLHASGTKQNKNMATFFGRMYQIRYLCGIIAGMQTDTDEIGYVAAFPIEEVNRGINAFTLGVKSVNTQAKVYVSWSMSWEDDEAVADAAYRLLDGRNIDVVTTHSDSLKAIDIASGRGLWTIGYNYDNSDKYGDKYLAAAVWDWGDFYEQRILECLQGRFQGVNYWESMDTGIVKLTKLSDRVKPGIRYAVETAKAKLMKGGFDVFYGPVYDNNGELRINEGENISDKTMMYDFKWYVEGVETVGQ